MLKQIVPPKYTKHSKTGTREYTSWAQMWSRCTNPNTPNYKNHGGRGISCCNRWKSFIVFLSDMGVRPTPKHTLDRIDNDGNYTPDNCRWATRTEQARNTRNNRIITSAGKSLCIADWSDVTGIKRSTIRNRLHKGWSEVEAVSTPVRKRYRHIK